MGINSSSRTLSANGGVRAVFADHCRVESLLPPHILKSRGTASRGRETGSNGPVCFHGGIVNYVCKT
jgi:hypothetical protein